LLRIKKKGYKGMQFSDPEPEVSKLQIDGVELTDNIPANNLSVDESSSVGT
jgi:hypothetical protein